MCLTIVKEMLLKITQTKQKRKPVSAKPRIGRPPIEEQRMPWQIRLLAHEKVAIERAAALTDEPASSWARDVLMRAVAKRMAERKAKES